MKCVRCDTEKEPDAFYAKDRTCKDCRCALVKANRDARADYYREYDQRRAAREDRKAQNRRVTAEWRAQNPRERAAQVTLGNAVRDGRVLKWPTCSMPDCSSTRPVAHHPDYDRPLDVVWLCQAHHKQAHALAGK